ncbi:Hypothetical protein R9X50_00749500 [Acrodontium crateriforme]|uniref:Rhodopsin domain-containing protein n=1 Tax=Acrodontium crateriforme TaxID=150365 RepID=A0AAQ3RE69_9PEZI|nr:Hypothetical protein R9X50_00749500 [Acrodontium crateriforme]
MEVQDLGVHVRIAVGASIGTSLMILCARAVSRWPWRFNAGSDDFAAIFATALSFAQGVIVVQAALLALGLPPGTMSQDNISTAMEFLYASNILFVTVLYASQLAITLTLHRLSHDKNDLIFSKTMLASTGIFFFISFILVAAERNAPKAELNRRQSSGILARWATISAMTVLLNIFTVIQSIYLIYNLQMTRASKGKIGLGFGLRLLLIPLSIIRLLSLRKSLQNNDFLYHCAITEVFVQVEMCYAVVCATLPCLHPFMDAAQSNMLDLGRITSATISSSLRPTNDYPLSRTSHSRGLPMGLPKQGSTGISTKISTTSEQDKSSSTADLIADDSRVIMVRRDINVAYSGANTP